MAEKKLTAAEKKLVAEIEGKISRHFGKVLEDAYRKADLPLYCVGKADCGHHPHGLEDNTELLAFIAAQIQA